jgi:hypothetical protein
VLSHLQLTPKGQNTSGGEKLSRKAMQSGTSAAVDKDAGVPGVVASATKTQETMIAAQAQQFVRLRSGDGHEFVVPLDIARSGLPF